MAMLEIDGLHVTVNRNEEKGKVDFMWVTVSDGKDSAQVAVLPRDGDTAETIARKAIRRYKQYKAWRPK